MQYEILAGAMEEQALRQAFDDWAHGMTPKNGAELTRRLYGFAGFDNWPLRGFDGLDLSATLTTTCVQLRVNDKKAGRSYVRTYTPDDFLARASQAVQANQVTIFELLEADGV